MRRFHTADLAGLVSRARLTRFHRREVRSSGMAKPKSKEPTEPKIGRPSRAGEPGKLIGFLATSAEREDYQAAASAVGLSLSQWIRAACSAEIARAAKRKKG